jgi:copper chaperone CopZ
MSTAPYPGTGMTCKHRVASVIEEVAEVPGVPTCRSAWRPGRSRGPGTRPS